MLKLLVLFDDFKNSNALSKEEFISKYDLEINKQIIAILPGSRVQEIKLKLPIMLEATKDFSDYQIVLAAAPSIIVYTGTGLY